MLVKSHQSILRCFWAMVGVKGIRGRGYNRSLAVALADVNLIFQSNPDDVELALHQMGIDPLQLMNSGSVH